ncbi:alanine racemase [Haloactinopolyspora sp.]|uniref:alanine racemase n=1 Tax=Haloactinopolyspora sp. TaxID=1966353 RepID=UPI0026186B20|nr:alanine racemase [Haloactinopolyspora sp.]
MPLTLHVDAARWRDHVRRYVDQSTGNDGVVVVPVTKGNGYGFGNAVLATESQKLGVPTLAVGTYSEVTDVATAFTGDILVLSPWRPWYDDVDGEARIVHTVSRLDDLHELAAAGSPRPRVVVEIRTSIRRHGIPPAQLQEAASALADVQFEGFALHLPLAGDHLSEARDLAAAAFDTRPDDDGRQLWVSHLAPTAASALATEFSADVRLRVATALWLGERSALRPRATVLDVHRVRRGETFGYRQRRARRDGTLLVIDGGTAHGIALEAPTPATTVRQRAVALAKGGLESAGRALSPFRVAGRQRWFAEPPHMQCSMIWLPGDVEPPAIGAEIDLDVRLTTTTFDRIRWDD